MSRTLEEVYRCRRTQGIRVSVEARLSLQSTVTLGEKIDVALTYEPAVACTVGELDQKPIVDEFGDEFVGRLPTSTIPFRKNASHPSHVP